MAQDKAKAKSYEDEPVNEPRESVKKVGTIDESAAYKHEGIGAVSQESMKANAAVAVENKADRQEARERQLDTSVAAADKLLEQGRANKKELGSYQDDAIGNEVAQELEEMPLRRVVDHSNQAEMHGQTAASPTMEVVMTTKLIKGTPKAQVKVQIVEGLAALYDEFEAGLSSGEKEAYAYNPEGGLHAFRKFMSQLDETSLRGKILKLQSQSKK